MKAFEPEFAGKMNFYLSAVNDLLRHPDDQPTNPLAYPNTGWPKVFPKNCRGSLPTIEELENELASIGIILCKTRERFVAEYALRDINKPIGISEYRLAESLPEKLQGILPTIEELENELGAASEEDTL